MAQKGQFHKIIYINNISNIIFHLKTFKHLIITDI